MKSLLLALAFLLLSFVVYAQLNTFKEGDVISAEQMNENFQYLEQQFRGARATTVNCDDGETINEAIEKGYTNITVSGTCNENLLFGVTNPSVGYSQKLAPRLLKLSGADSSATIKDTLENIQPLINIQGSTTLIIENLILDGGNDGVFAAGNSDLILNDVTVQNFTGRGIYITDSTNFDSYTNITIEGRGQGTGLSLCGGSFGVFSKAAISDVYTGIQVSCNSGLWVSEFDISNVNTGIRVNYSKFNQFSENPGTISNVRGKGIDLNQSTGRFLGLRMLDFDNTGSGWNPAIHISNGSNVDLENVQITGSTDEALIGIDRGSTAEIRNANISGDFDTLMMIGQSSYVGLNRSSLAGNAIGKLIGVFQLSTLTVRDSSIDSNSRGDGINLSNSSNLQLENVNIDSEDNSLYLTTGSVAQIRGNSNINSANGPSVVIDRGSGVRLGFGPKINSINDSVFEIRKSSWLDMDGFEEVGVPTENLVRQDPGPTISIRDMSFLSVGNGNYIEEVTCFGQSFVSLGGGIINDLSSSCTGDGNSGTSNNSDVGSLSDLQGSWLTTCQADGDSFSTELLEVNETDATISVSIYPDSECTTAEALFTASISNLSVGEDIDFDDGSSGYKFSLIQQGLTITPLFDEMAAQFNQYSLCGKTDWAPNQSTEVMGLSCDFEYPAKDVIQYGAYKILGSSLYLGESSPRGYPPNVDGYPFVKQ